MLINWRGTSEKERRRAYSDFAFGVRDLESSSNVIS
jgi:hypothetical protein